MVRSAVNDIPSAERPGRDATGHTLSDPTAEAARILDVAARERITLRLLGGVAIALLTGGRRVLPRAYKDVDFIAPRQDGRAIERLLPGLGYEPSTAFNGLHGNRRLLFFDLANERQVDVFVGEFAMCHSWPMRERLTLAERTLPPADLLLTKLQIRELTEKDQRDALTLVYHCDLRDHDAPGAINVDYLAGLCGRDWGLWRTCTLSLERLSECVKGYSLSEEQHSRVTARLAHLRERVENTPKSTSWKIRARIGERVKWYDEPEEVG
jgi:hypothetical protein